MISRVGALQVNLPHSWGTSYGNRLSKDIVCNTKGRKLIGFCERNIFKNLNGKYGADTQGEETSIDHAGRSAIGYVLV
jgi:hypothetical protein